MLLLYAIFFQIKFFIKKKSQEYDQSVNQFWIQLRSARQNVEPDLDPNCSQMLLVDDTGMESYHRNLKHLSLVMRKPAFCNCENKDADQLRGNREADQRLCFRYTDSTIPLLPKSEISSL